LLHLNGCLARSISVTLPARRLPKDLHALEELLRDGQVRRAPALSPRKERALPTGFAALDAALGGGLARGQLHEIVGPPGAGGTALVRAALASATQAGENCALIDPGDAFDPAHGGALLVLARAAQAGTFAAATIELERGRAQWEGRQGAPGRFLRGTNAVGAVARHKRMPPSPPLPFHLKLEPT